MELQFFGFSYSAAGGQQRELLHKLAHLPGINKKRTSRLGNHLHGFLDNGERLLVALQGNLRGISFPILWIEQFQ